MKTVRRLVPSVKDLLPTFDFLKDPSGTSFKDIETHKQKNNTLTELNQALTEPTKSLMNIIYGNNQNTLDAIKVTSINVPPANWVHQTLGLWEDGEPIHTCPAPLCEYTDHNKDYSSSMVYSNQGDQTVLAKSATINGVGALEISDQHGNLANNFQSIEKIFALLDISGSPSTSSLSLFQKAIAFLIRSPAKITVTDPLGNEAGFQPSGTTIENSFYDDEANFLVIPNPLAGEYQIKIAGTDEGEYGLLIGRLKENSDVLFNEYQFPTEEGKIDQFSMNTEGPVPILDDPNGLLALKSARSKIENIRKEGKLKCPLKAQLFLLDKSEKLIQKGNFRAASIMIKTSLRLLNHCLLASTDDQLLSSWPLFESAVTNLTDAYTICANNAHLYFQPEKIQKILTLQENRLQKINDRFQKKSDKGKEIPIIIVTLFEKSAGLLQEAREALDQGNLPRAYILQFQVDLILPSLR